MKEGRKEGRKHNAERNPRDARRTTLFAATTLLVLGFCVTSTRSQAQSQSLPTRDDFVFHYQVDPLHGDNALATQQNPSPTATVAAKRPLGLHPEVRTTPVVHWVAAGVLQYAPYPFKTLTGPQGALAHINQFYSPTTFPDAAWVNPDNGKRVVAIVIHCLPGVYGPVDINGGLPLQDAASGLPCNGEQWPARIRSRVSLQGVSALDTIFHARGTFAPILEVTEPDVVTPPQESHLLSFVDSIAIRGARSPSQGTAPLGTGAGVYIYGNSSGQWSNSSRITISNCMIYDNVIGIALDLNGTGTGQRPRIVNNTIAWNACGMWQGDSLASGGQSNGNSHVPMILNNIFDSGSPPGFIAGISGFEGVGARDRQVSGIGGVTLNPQIDFNAWEYEIDGTPFVNTRQPISPYWPATFETNSQPPVGPRVDIRPFTRGLGGPRPGILYVNDVLRRYPPQGLPAGFEYSSHDFRLAPSVSMGSEDPRTAQILNPLVNQGGEFMTNYEQGLALQAFTFSNTTTASATLDYAPGLPPTSEAVPVHAWDWDSEGFVNRRVAPHPAFASQFLQVSPEIEMEFTIDIGADELGTNIVAGYIENTRMFGMRKGTVSNGLYQASILFFNVATPAGSGVTYPRPFHNMYIGGRQTVGGLPSSVFHWWNHKLIGGDKSVGEFTRMPTEATLLRWVPLNGTPSKMPIARPLECDFGGHLLPDIHPYWAAAFPPGGPADEYASNPWHGEFTLYLTFGEDNPALYHNIGGVRHGHDPVPPSVPEFRPHGYAATSIVDATLNPPGSQLGGPTNLVSIVPPTVFGPFAPCVGSALNSYAVGAYGYGDVANGCPDQIPYDPAVFHLGIRWNLQGLDTQANLTNLQTFLTIGEPGIDLPEAEARRIRTSLPIPRDATGQEIRRLIETIRRLPRDPK